MHRIIQPACGVLIFRNLLTNLLIGISVALKSDIIKIGEGQNGLLLSLILRTLNYKAVPPEQENESLWSTIGAAIQLTQTNEDDGVTKEIIRIS